MTIEEITQTLQIVAENQAQFSSDLTKLTNGQIEYQSRQTRTDERLDRIDEDIAQVVALQKQHSADIAEIDKMIATLVRSQNRYDTVLSRHDDILHDLADKQLKNEERFADLADAQRRYEERQGRLEASFELLEGFVRDFRNETNDRFAETDKRLAELASAQALSVERGAEVDNRLAALASAQAKTDEQINALIKAQARADERINELLNRNGGKPKARAKKAVKKGAKKKGGAAK